LGDIGIGYRAENFRLKHVYTLRNGAGGIAGIHIFRPHRQVPGSYNNLLTNSLVPNREPSRSNAEVDVYAHYMVHYWLHGFHREEIERKSASRRRNDD